MEVVDIPHEHEEDGRSLKSDKDKDDGRSLKSDKDKDDGRKSERKRDDGSAHKLEIKATSGDKISSDSVKGRSVPKHEIPLASAEPDEITSYKTWYYSAKCLGVLEELDAKK